MRSGSMVQAPNSWNSTGAGASAVLPRGAPASTQTPMVSISSSVNDRSFLNPCSPTLGSTCHGGISRASTLVRIDLAQGLVSW